MRLRRMIYRKNMGWAVWLGIFIFFLAHTNITNPPKVEAVMLYVQSKTAVANSTSVTASFATTPAANHLLIAVCGSNISTTFSTPAGFSVAKNEAGTPSQGIFYKVAAGNESSIICSGTLSGRQGIHIYEYSGTLATTPFELANPTTSSRTLGTAQSSGSLTTTNANDMLFAAVTANANATYTAWSNVFTERNDFMSNTQTHLGSADKAVTAMGTYTTTATSSRSAAWRGQIAAFKLMPIQLIADIVDAGGNTVATPTIVMTPQSFSFGCVTSTGTLGTASQKIRITNTTSSPAWQLSIAPTAGPTATWTDGTNSYDVNDSTGSGCGDGVDADTVAGQLTINPVTATITPTAGCVNTGVTLGTSTALTEGATDSAVIVSGGSTATLNCTWDITGVTLSQTIPAEQTDSPNYQLGLTLTITAK